MRISYHLMLPLLPNTSPCIPMTSMRVASIDINENCMRQNRRIAIQFEDISTKNKAGKIRTNGFTTDALTKSMLVFTNKSLPRSQKKVMESDAILKMSKSRNAQTDIFGWRFPKNALEKSITNLPGISEVYRARNNCCSIVV